MKAWATILAAMAAALCLSAPASAEGLDEEMAEAYGVNELEQAAPESARDALGELSVEDALDPDSLLERLASSAAEALGEQLRGAVAPALKLLAAAALCALAGAFATDMAKRYVNLAGCLAVGAAAFTDAAGWIKRGGEAVTELGEFSRALLPCLTATAAAGGLTASAAAKYAAASLFMDLLLTAVRSLILPLAYALLAVRIAAAALDNGALDAAGRLIRWLALTVTTLIMSAFTLFISFSGVIASSADALANKAARTALSAALPVVGGIISDAAAALVAGAGVLRAAVGALGAAVVLGVCLAPFLALGLRYLLYKAAAALASAFAGGRVGALISDVGSVFALVLGVTGAAAAMLFVSIISFVRAVGL